MNQGMSEKDLVYECLRRRMAFEKYKLNFEELLQFIFDHSCNLLDLYGPGMNFESIKVVMSNLLRYYYQKHKEHYDIAIGENTIDKFYYNKQYRLVLISRLIQNLLDHNVENIDSSVIYKLVIPVLVIYTLDYPTDIYQDQRLEFFDVFLDQYIFSNPNRISIFTITYVLSKIKMIFPTLDDPYSLTFLLSALVKIYYILYMKVVLKLPQDEFIRRVDSIY